MDLDDPRWGIIGVIFGLVGLAGSFLISVIALPGANLQCFGLIVVISTIISLVVVYRKLRKSKHLTYQVVSNTLLLSIEEKEGIKGRVQVLLDNKPVGDVRLVTLQIWNSGSLPIALTDYVEPIVINFGMLAEVLAVEMIRKTQKNINTQFSLKGGELILEPISLSRRDTIAMKILLTRFNEEIGVFAQINGIELIKNWDKTAYVLIAKTGIFFYLMIVTAFILSFIVLYGVTNVSESILGVLSYQNVNSWNYVVITAFSGIITYITNLLIKIFKPEILPESLRP